MDGLEEASGETREEESRGSVRDHTFDTGGARFQFHLAAEGARVLVLLVRQDELLALHLVCPTFFPVDDSDEKRARSWEVGYCRNERRDDIGLFLEILVVGLGLFSLQSLA